MSMEKENTDREPKYGFTVVDQEGIKIFRLRGTWDFDSFGDLRLSLERELIDAEAVILNFKDISYINSIGITVIAQCHLMAQEKGIPLVLTHIQDPVKTVFEITDLTKKIRIFQSENDAIKALA